MHILLSQTFLEGAYSTQTGWLFSVRMHNKYLRLNGDDITQQPWCVPDPHQACCGLSPLPLLALLTETDVPSPFQMRKPRHRNLTSPKSKSRWWT